MLEQLMKTESSAERAPLFKFRRQKEKLMAEA
jgi:hypothetical protein